MNKEELHKKSLTKLAELQQKVDSLLDEAVEEFSPEEINYLLSNYSNYLKIDVSGALNKKRTDTLKSSPLDELFNT